MRKSDTCQHCGERHGIRCTPATDLELARMIRARETGKAPKPTWYKAPVLKRDYVPIYSGEIGDMAQCYPAHVRSLGNGAQSDTFNANMVPRETDAEKYIREYEKARGLVPVPITWVKTEGNFA